MDEVLAGEIWRMLHAPSVDPDLHGAGMRAVANCLEREGGIDSLNAFWHPLGFILIRLANLPDGCLRLHIWPGFFQGDEYATGRVHEHRWTLASYVLCGRLQNRTFRVSEVSGSSGLAVYEVDSIEHHGAEDVATPLGPRVVSEAVAAESYGAGDRYFLAPRVFHSTEIHAAPCATLVGETTGTGEPSRSLSPADLSSRSTTATIARRSTRKRVDQQQLRSVLHETVAAIQEGACHLGSPPSARH